MKVIVELNKFVQLEITGSYVPYVKTFEEEFPSEFLITHIKQIKGELIHLIEFVAETSNFDKWFDEKILEEIEK